MILWNLAAKSGISFARHFPVTRVDVDKARQECVSGWPLMALDGATLSVTRWVRVWRNCWIQLSLREELFEQISLSECISDAGHGFYTWQCETRHRQRKWRKDLLTWWNCLDVDFKKGAWWPYITMLMILTSREAYSYSMRGKVAQDVAQSFSVVIHTQLAKVVRKFALLL
jgi:hypothetical protein